MKNVLIVEDEPLVAFHMSSVLETAGMMVVGPAVSPGHAMLRASSDDIDLAIISIGRDDRPALQVAVLLRERGIPFIFITDRDAWSLPPALQARALLRKPVPDLELRRAASSVLAGRSACSA